MFLRLFLFLIAVTALPALAFYTYDRHATPIETAIQRAAQGVLDAEDNHALSVTADGRDVFVSGSVPATGALQRIVDTLDNLSGVRHVNTAAVRQGGSEESFNGDVAFHSRVTADAKGIVITGDAPSRAARARALALTGSKTQLEINPNGDDAWMDIVILINRYRRQFDSLDLVYRDTVATVEGSTADNDALRSLKIDLANVSTSRLNIVENLELSTN